MTNTQVEIITSVQRRRRWTAAEKERLVAASLEPGAGVSAIAREAGIHPSQLYGWRRQMRCGRSQGAPGFAAVQVAVPVGLAMSSGVIDIEFGTEARMRITGAVDPATLSAAVTALTARARR